MSPSLHVVPSVANAMSALHSSLQSDPAPAQGPVPVAGSAPMKICEATPMHVAGNADKSQDVCIPIASAMKEGSKGAPSNSTPSWQVEKMASTAACEERGGG